MVAPTVVPTDVSIVERALIDVQELRRRNAGAVLFHEGEPAKGVYIIHSGAVDLLFAARNGATRPLQTAGPGQIVGLSAIVSKHPHDSSAVVRVPSELGYVDGGVLMSLLDRDPSLWFAVLRFLSEDVNACWDSIRRIAAER